MANLSDEELDGTRHVFEEVIRQYIGSKMEGIADVLAVNIEEQSTKENLLDSLKATQENAALMSISFFFTVDLFDFEKDISFVKENINAFEKWKEKSGLSEEELEERYCKKLDEMDTDDFPTECGCTKNNIRDFETIMGKTYSELDKYMGR